MLLQPIPSPLLDGAAHFQSRAFGQAEKADGFPEVPVGLHPQESGCVVGKAHTSGEHQVAQALLNDCGLCFAPLGLKVHQVRGLGDGGDVRVRVC